MVSANEELADTVKELERTKEEYKGIEEDALKVPPKSYIGTLKTHKLSSIKFTTHNDLY